MSRLEPETAHARAARVARASYGRLLAILAARSRDIVAAEDTLAEAFLQALEHWPVSGVPPNPEAWLITVARHKAIDAARRDARTVVTAVDDLPDVMADGVDPQAIPDRRLALMFVCAHPAIDASVHTPLMLQTVLGYEAADIGRSFLVSPSAIAQRLVRAKRKIRDSGIAFQLPEKSEMPERLQAVLEAVYGAYALDWQEDLPASEGDTADVPKDMAAEALYLARLLAALLPEQPEALGLAALLGYSHARRVARTHQGVFVPLDQQAPALWDAPLMAQAQDCLSRAAALRCLGRFQLEAAIQSVHAQRAQTGVTDWPAILHLYEGLCQRWPTLGARLGRVSAVGHVAGAPAALAALAAMDAAELAGFQPAQATWAHWLAQAGRWEEADQAWARAASLTTSPSVRRWLEHQRAARTIGGRESA